MGRNILLMAFCCSLFWGCQSHSTGTQTNNDAQIDTADIDRFIAELSADEYLGRKPFTTGETKTLNYLEQELKEMDLEPGNGSSYFQDVPLVEITPNPAETMMVEGSNQSYELKLGEDFVIYTQQEREFVELAKSQLVFCGYGIVAPEYNWNDYKGIDMTGKTAVVLVNDPGFQGADNTFFKGNTMTYYGRWTYKYEEAARQGAAGILIVHETKAAGYPWFVVSNSWSGAKLDLQTSDGNAGLCDIQGWLTLTAAAGIFDAAGRKGTNFLELARQPGFEPMPLEATVSTSVENTFKKDVSKNVVAMITGSKRPDEYIIYSAHWDHLGVGGAVAGDSIYNGAQDNASGTAAVMAIAHTFSELPEKPERSVVFLFVTAEEQGLLGSAYYAANPIFPIESTVANLNLDAMNNFGPMKDLIITGYGHSQMDDYATAAAEDQGRYVVPDQEPEKGYFFRSDHFNFAKVGIPALYAKGGLEHKQRGKAYAAERRNEYTTERYHRPSDEYDDTWNLGGIAQDAQLYFEIGRRLANEETFPQWKEGSEFKAKRDAAIE